MSQTGQGRPSVLRAARQRTRAEITRQILDAARRHLATEGASGLSLRAIARELDARRDWGFAADYVRAMWLILQQDEPDDYVVASGTLHSARELVELAFEHVGLDWEEHVRIDQSLKRGEAELHHLVGDPSKAHSALGWCPSVSFPELVRLLVDAAVERLRG